MEFPKHETLPEYKQIYQKGFKTTKQVEEEYDSFSNYLQGLKYKSDDIDKSKLLNDFYLFSQTYFSHLTEDRGVQIPFAKFHHQMIDAILEPQDVFLGTFILPRSFSKSTIMMMLCIYLIIKGDLKTLLYISDTDENATRQVILMKNEFLKNERLIRDFNVGEIKGSGGDFIIPNLKTCVYSFGVGSSPRGLRNLMTGKRIDMILCDDIDSNKIVRNPRLVKQLVNYFKDELMKTVDMNHYKIIVIGNRYNGDQMLLSQVQKMEGMYSMEVKSLVNNVSQWPERYSTDILLRERDRNPISFEREMQHNNIIEGSVFKTEWLIYNKVPESMWDRIIFYMDAAYANSQNSDNKACVILIKTTDDKYYVYDIFCSKKYSLEFYCEWVAKEWVKLIDRGYHPIVWYESNFLQGQILQTEFKRIETNITNRYISTIPDKRKKSAKSQTIESMITFFRRNLLIFDEDLQFNNEHFKEFLIEYSGFELSGSNVHDDGMDALANAIQLLPLKEIRNSNTPLISNRDTENYIF